MSKPSSQPPSASQAGPGEYLAEHPPRRRHLVVAAACVVVIYLAGVSGAWWPTPDSAMYLGLGRSLFNGQGYSFNGQPNNFVTPGMPLIFGSLSAVFGEGFWAPNLFVALCGLGGLALTWRTLGYLTSRRMAMAATLATAMCYTYYDYSHLLLTDATFVLLFWAILYCLVRYLRGSGWWLAPVALLAAAAVTVKVPGMLILGPLSVAVVVERRSGSSIARRLIGGGVLLAGTAGTGGAFYLIGKAMSAEPLPYVAKHVTNPSIDLWYRIGNIPKGWSHLPKTVGQMLSGQSGLAMEIVGGLLLVVALAAMVRALGRGSRLVPTLLVVVVTTLPFCSASGFWSIRARYLYPLHALWILVILEGVFWGVERFRRWRSLPVGPTDFLKAATVLTVLVIAMNIPKILRAAVYYSYRGHTGRYHEVIEDGKYAELRPVAQFLRSRFGPETPIAMRRDRMSMIHFLSERTAVGFKKVDPFDPWNPAQAEQVYADLMARPEVEVILHDVGGLDKRYAKRLSELLDTSPEFEVLDEYQGETCKVYVRRKALPERGPAPAT